MSVLDPITGEKTCPKCKKTGTADDFFKNKSKSDGLMSWCRKCMHEKQVLYKTEHPETEREWIRLNHAKRLLYGCRIRARIKDLPCTITFEDIIIPNNCPLPRCKRELVRRDDRKTGSWSNSPSVDMYNPKLGYIPGNVWVICMDCNRRKYDMSGEDMIKLGQELIDTFKEYNDNRIQDLREAA